MDAFHSYTDIEVWILVASKEVGSNEVKLLRKEANEKSIEILVLDTRNGLGPLHVFLAAHEEVTRTFVFDHGIADQHKLKLCLSDIRAAPKFDESVASLSRLLSGCVLSFSETRNRVAEYLHRGVQHKNEARRIFGQDIVLREDPRGWPIRREKISHELDTWWSSSQTVTFALLGEEGTGKTWAMMAWLLDLKSAHNPPLVLAVTSNAVREDGSLTAIASEALWRSSGHEKDRAWWERKILSWLESDLVDDPPRILVFLDGLNERPNVRWRHLLVEAEESRWEGRLRLVITSRPRFWQFKVKNWSNSFQELITDGYNDQELHEAIQGSGRTMDDIPEDLRELIRKPRYCSLVLDHFGELLESGELTVERLLYIDYQKRYEQKMDQPISPHGFREILAELARRSLAEWNPTGTEATFSSRDLEDILPGGSEKMRALQEINDGGLMEESNLPSGGYVVTRRLLVHGLGMLLAEDLRRHGSLGVDECSDHVRSWLEPQPDMDLKSEMLEAAAFFSLPEVINDYPTSARRALIREWIGSRNLSEQQISSIGAYLPSCARDLLIETEYFWKHDVHDRQAQNRLATILLGRRNDPRVKEALIPTFERWMAFIPVNGEPFLRRIHEDHPDQPSPKSKLREQFDQDLIPGEMAQYGGWSFPVIEDDGHLSLARFALYIISAGDRAPFARSFILWALSRQLMGYPLRESEEVAWVLRLADEDLWPSMGPELLEMSTGSDEVSHKAAHNLLGCLGTEEALALRENKLNGLYPVSAGYSQYIEDPCSSGYTWKREHCEPCLKREDIDIDRLVRGLEDFCQDPTLNAPIGLQGRLATAASQIPVGLYHSTNQTSRTDLKLDDLTPVLARFAPRTLGDTWRRVFSSIPGRTLEGQRLLAMILPENALVLKEAECELLDSFSDDLRKTSEDWPLHLDSSDGGRQKTAETFIFLGSAMHRDPETLANMMISQPKEAFLLGRLQNWLAPLTNQLDQVMLDRMVTEKENFRLIRILWILAFSEPELSDVHREKILAAVESDIAILRCTALLFIRRRNDARLAQMLIDSNSTFLKDDDTLANQHGCAVLCQHSEKFTFPELAKRLPAYAQGVALVKRGLRINEVDAYTQLIDEGLGILSKRESIASQPIMVQSCGDVVRLHSVEDRPSTIHLSNEHTWGGTAGQNSLEDLRNLLGASEKIDERLESLEIAMRDACRQDIEGWRLNKFSITALQAVIRSHPELTREWTSIAGSIGYVAAGFCQSFAAALVREEPSRGFKLWRKLTTNEQSTKFMVQKASTDWLMCLPFEAQDSPAAQAARCESLNDARNDLSIIEIVTAAQAYGKKAWVLTEAQRLMSMAPLWRKAKGLMLAASADLDTETFDEITSNVCDADSWVSERMPFIWNIHQNNRWSRHWYWQFLTAQNNDEAHAGYVLFQRCVDRRWWIWVNEVEDQARKKKSFDERRLRYRQMNIDRIQQAIDRNEKKRKDTFIGIKIRPGQVVGLGQ